MRKAYICFILGLLGISATAQEGSNNFEGKWRTQDGFTVEIVKKENNFEGTSLERQKVVMENLQFADNKWRARMIRPKDGLSAEATVTINGNEMHIHMKKGFLSKKLTWLRL